MKKFTVVGTWTPQGPSALVVTGVFAGHITALDSEEDGDENPWRDLLFAHWVAAEDWQQARSYVVDTLIDGEV